MAAGGVRRVCGEPGLTSLATGLQSSSIVRSMTGIGSTFRAAGLGDLLLHGGLFANWRESMVKIMGDALVEASAGITNSADDVAA